MPETVLHQGPRRFLKRRVHSRKACFYFHKNIRHAENGVSDQERQHTKRQIHHIEKSHQDHTKDDFRDHQRQDGNIFQDSLCLPVDPGKPDCPKSSDHRRYKAAYHSRNKLFPSASIIALSEKAPDTISGKIR